MRFRTRVLSLLASSLIAATALAQSDANEQRAGFRFQDGGTGGMMQSIFIPPKPNAPFSMTLFTEWTRPLDTGGSYTMTNERRIARDSSGRIFQERRFLVPKDSWQEPPLRIIQIMDPAQHTVTNCNPRTRTCEIFEYRLITGQNYEPALVSSGPLPDGVGVRRADDLGIGSTAGVETHGYREVTTYNPGTAGNDRKMVSKREFWYSPQLAVDLLSIVDEPRSGKQVFTASDVSMSEPDPALFEVPAGYKVVDRRSGEGSN